MALCVGGCSSFHVKIELMKKIVLIILILIIGAFLYYALRNNLFTSKTEAPQISEGSDFNPDPSNATFTFESEPVTLSAGRNERTVAPGSAMTEETVLLDKFAYGDINTDDKKDTALLLVQYGAGSGTFTYVAVFVSGPLTYKGSEAVFIGDRIVPQSISISNGIVTVTYLDRKSNESMTTEPTVLVSKEFVFKNGEFQEK